MAFEIDLLNLRVEVRKQLWIIEKQIDVVAFPMIDLKHESGAATKAPARFKPNRVRCVGNNLYGDVEELGPLARPMPEHAL